MRKERFFWSLTFDFGLLLLFLEKEKILFSAVFLQSLFFTPEDKKKRNDMFCLLSVASSN